MTYTELICDLGIFALIAVAAVICGILLLAFAYTIICFLAWIEDEVLRWFARRRRRARMCARAAENRARMQEKKPSVREGKNERRCGGYTSSTAGRSPFPSRGRQGQTEVRRA